MATLPLDIEDLLGELDRPAHGEYAGLPAGTIMGHVHLKVADLAETIAFFRDVLGFALMAQLGAQAAFLAAGGYHHHIGANNWESAGATPPPAGAAALRHATLVLADEDERERLLARVRASGQEPLEGAAGPTVHDPSGNVLLLTLASS